MPTSCFRLDGNGSITIFLKLFSFCHSLWRGRKEEITDNCPLVWTGEAELPARE